MADNRTPKIRALLSRLTPILTGGPALVVFGLILSYLLFGWFAAAPLIKWGVPKFIADRSGHRLALDQADFDPLALSLSLKGLRLQEPDGKPLLEFDELFVDCDAASLLRRALVFEAIRLQAPRLSLERRPDGSLNWSPLIAAFKTEEEPDKPPPRLLLRRLSLERGRLDFIDRQVAGGFTTSLDPLNLSLADISTLEEDRGSSLLTATTASGARLRWKGDLRLTPFASSGELSLDRLTLARLDPYLKKYLLIKPPGGQAALSCAYQVGYQDKKLSLGLDRIALELTGIRLHGLKAGQPALALDRVTLENGRFDPGRREISLGSLSLDGGMLRLKRDQSGRIDLLDWLPPPPPRTVDTKPGPPWKLTLAELHLDKLGLRFTDTSHAGTSNAELDGMAFSSAITAEIGGDSPRVALDGSRLSVSALRLRQGQNGVTLGRISLEGALVLQSSPGSSFIQSDRLNLGISPLRLESGELSATADGLKAVSSFNLRRGDDAPGALLAGLKLGLTGLRLHAKKSDPPILVLGEIALTDGELDLGKRQWKAAALDFRRGQLALVRGNNGRIALLDELKGLVGAEKKTGTPAAETPGWHYSFGRIALSDFHLGLRDEGVSPAASLHLDRINASVDGLSERLDRALPVQLGFAIREGGLFKLDGTVVPAGPALDLNLSLVNLALSPAQPYLSHFADLHLAAGSASLKGRIRASRKNAAPLRPTFRGGFELNDLLLAEAKSGEPFLYFERLAGSKVQADPASLRISDLRLDDLGAKIVVSKDKSTNLKKILKAQPAAIAKPMPPASPSPPAKPSETQTDIAAGPFQLTIDRIRFERGAVDFSDHSLVFPFSTQVHGMKGLISNIASLPGEIAELELEGAVGEFGMARASGRVDLFHPTTFMDIKTLFRNVEMQTLSPYSATFAGYRIASGRLSLDLLYKIEKRQLLGENTIIMDQLNLGERVETPGLKHLPLALAIAILKDSDGRIDLGLPVAGSLDDPKFSYSSIIWKAFFNLLTKVVSSPFRALGSLFGGSGEGLEQIAFEPGRSELTPPEKEKFGQIGKILEKRSGLALVIRGSWSPTLDRAAFQERQLRRAVAEKGGLVLVPDEDPGPISTTASRSKRALEKLYAERFGEQAWKRLFAQWRQANPDHREENLTDRLRTKLADALSANQRFSEEELKAMKNVDLYALLHQRLLASEKVSDEALVALAARRGAVIVEGLTAVGVPSDRVRLDAPQASSGTGRDVPVRLELIAAEAHKTEPPTP